ncbi:type 4 pilus major pilin [Fundidesulfovibrio putealis]|uniref:type 4 pilus major pilin n=1 Tax=Fundidesulfovibrio putealis TaxID=270496 RepID=UPI00041F6CC7|nr:type 4 pilus major pilin [Fundidesulfovibrio putealis]KAF0234899.1 MAG: PilS domain-containing [Desulfovibrionaceae bacterium]
MSFLETIGAILVALIVLAGAALGLQKAFTGVKLNDTEQNLIVLRMQTQQLFSGSPGYTGLDNTMALNAGLVPKQFVKGTELVNPFGGTITLAASSDGSSFTITLTGVPREESTKLATFQADAWLGVSVNGTDVTGGSVSDIQSACSSSNNTIIFAAR